MNKLTYFLLGLLPLSLFSQVHPRGIVDKADLQRLSAHREAPIRKSILAKFEYSMTQLEHRADSIVLPFEEYLDLALYKTFIDLCKGDSMYSQDVFSLYEKFIKDSILFDVESFGLTRATYLQGMAYIYDFNANYWSHDQRVNYSEKLLELIANVSQSMGHEGNYAIESNWMGVRYGSIVLASLVYDEYKQPVEKSRADPYLWEARRRLEEHMNVFYTPQGWCVESMSYQGYDWMFVIPGFLALQNRFGDQFFNLPTFAPNAVDAIKPYIAATVAIPTVNGIGVQPDFADDDPMEGVYQLGQAFSIMDNRKMPAIRWMHDYMYDPTINSSRNQRLLFHYLFYPDTIEAVNPAQLDMNSYIDTTNGTGIFRNRFQDENDIVAAITATQVRMQGHSGPDNLSFRFIGLGNLWVVGAGRTPLIAGQTNLFAERPGYEDRGNNSKGKLLNYYSDKNGNAFMEMSGSCMGVTNHKRKFVVSYDSLLMHCPAAIIVNDSSQNGKFWRINTPGFNKVEILADGFKLISSRGDAMRVKVLDQSRVIVDTGRVRYGGNTNRLNYGIGFRGKYYEYNKWIDVHCNGNILVAITLEKKNQRPVNVYFNKKKREVWVEKKRIIL